MPVQTTISIRGATIVRQGLQNLRAEVPRIGAQRIYEAMQRAKRATTAYPPELPGQRYRRTGTYGAAWDVVRNPSTTAESGGWSLVGRAVDARGRDYTKYVSGSAYGTMQARVHQGRWVLVRDAVDAQVARLPKTIRAHIMQVARRENL